MADDQLPTTVNDYPLELQPLQHSHEWNELECELKQLFIEVFEETLRAKERDLNVYGMPHLGSFELISRFVKEDGLALVNNDDEYAMRYLYKAWAGRNPRRGLHFLRTYLQLLWPNRSAAYQLWYRKDKQAHYPLPLHEKIPLDPGLEISEEDYFLTCRVLALVEFDNDPVVRGVIEPALRSSLAAEFVLELRNLLPASGVVNVGGTAIINQLVSLHGDFEFRTDIDTGSLGLGGKVLITSSGRFSGDFEFADQESFSSIMTGSHSEQFDVIRLDGDFELREN